MREVKIYIKFKSFFLNYNLTNPKPTRIFYDTEKNLIWRYRLFRVDLFVFAIIAFLESFCKFPLEKKSNQTVQVLWAYIKGKLVISLFMSLIWCTCDVISGIQTINQCKTSPFNGIAHIWIIDKLLESQLAAAVTTSGGRDAKLSGTARGSCRLIGASAFTSLIN